MILLAYILLLWADRWWWAEDRPLLKIPSLIQQWGFFPILRENERFLASETIFLLCSDRQKVCTGEKKNHAFCEHCICLIVWKKILSPALCQFLACAHSVSSTILFYSNPFNHHKPRRVWLKEYLIVKDDCCVKATLTIFLSKMKPIKRLHPSHLHLRSWRRKSSTQCSCKHLDSKSCNYQKRDSVPADWGILWKHHLRYLFI